MNSERVVKAMLIGVGALLVGYAMSDHPLYGGEPGFGQSQLVIATAGLGLALCCLLSAEAAGRVLLVAVASLIMLGVAEIAGEFLLGPRYRPIFQPDDRLIFKFIPERRSLMTRAAVNGGGTVAHRINSAGFRGEELRPAGYGLRVVVYGDSFIHAAYTAGADTFTQQLGRLLESRLGGKVEAINAGVSSYGPDQISLKMADELPRLRPDLVVVAIFAGNDYGDLMRDKMFRLGPDGSLLENRWVLDPKVRTWFELGQRESILKRAMRGTLASLRRAWGSHSAKSESTRHEDFTDIDFLLAEAGREYQSFVVEHDSTITNTHLDYYSADVSLTPNSASARYKIALMDAVLRRMRDVAAASGTPLLFLFIPHPADVTDHYDAWLVDRRRYPDYDGRNQIAPLERSARTLGTPFVSLYDAFRTANSNELYYHGGDDHWNDAGQRMAAELVDRYVADQGLLKRTSPFGGPSTDAKHSVDGKPTKMQRE